MATVKEKSKESIQYFHEHGIKNPLASPRLEKVVVSSGTGSITDAKKKELVLDRLTNITGQKAAVRGAKKSIAGFKIREGNPIGAMVTLRGKYMYAFLDKLINIAIPRMRDFKGIPEKSVDAMGNLTIGIPEHTIFPEAQDEDLRDVFGLSITIVTSAKDKETAISYFSKLGIPLKKQ